MKETEKSMQHPKRFHNAHYYSYDIEQSLKTILNSKYEEICCNDACEANCHYRSADIFLNGSCQLFSLALHKRFGYKAYKIKWEGLPETHYFCMTCLGEVKVYIDVRGMTTDLDEFIKTFSPLLFNYAYRIEPQNLSEDARLESDGDIAGYAFANEIIDRYPCFYAFT